MCIQIVCVEKNVKERVKMWLDEREPIIFEGRWLKGALYQNGLVGLGE